MSKRSHTNKEKASQDSAYPTPEEIALRAYEIHLAHGGAHGRDLDDWLEAERELRAEYEGHSQGTPNKDV